ncbi:Oleate hydratase [Clarias magur]|uniref:Oleate hydratase n=1 Tax=Clarias magur TaxID=1594786 RepID=A0A8J4UBD9_CLAMG|nr:Oleate hydratase [Clarias magur]
MNAAWGQLPRKGALHRTGEGGHVLLMSIKHISDITYVHGRVHVSERDRPREDTPPMSQQDLLIVATGCQSNGYGVSVNSVESPPTTWPRNAGEETQENVHRYCMQVNITL